MQAGSCSVQWAEACMMLGGLFRHWLYMAHLLCDFLCDTWLHGWANYLTLTGGQMDTDPQPGVWGPLP